jgi:hypothetical protein
MSLTLVRSTGTDFTGNTVSISTNYGGNVPPIVLNDISNYFDGRTSIFPLKQETSSINTFIDSKDIMVTLNGMVLSPYVTENRLPWLVDYDSYRGYRVVGSDVIIYDSPDPGDRATVIIIGQSQTKQVRRYPFSPTTIGLGD